MLKPLATVLVWIAILSQPSMAAQEVSFQSSSTYFGKEVTLTGTLRLSGSHEKQPIVILLHGCGGLVGAVRTGLHSHANKLNNNGFATLVLDSFRPRGIERDWVCERISRLSAAQGYRQRDVKDAIKYLETIPAIDTSKVFVVGQSNGGSVSSLMTYKRNAKFIRAAVAYYPWCGAVPYKPLVPLLVFTAEKDDWTPPKECLDRAPGSANLTVRNYSGATHSFDLPIPRIKFRGHILEGDPKATRDSQNRMVKFFKKVLSQSN